jgi:hypothetical protein
MYELMMFAGAAMIVFGGCMVAGSFMDNEGEDVNGAGIGAALWKGLAVMRIVAERLRIMWIFRMAQSAVIWFLYKRHPVIQILYLGIIIGAYAAFFTFGFPHLPNPYFWAINKPISGVVLAVCLVSFAMASFTDPGVVTKDNALRYRRLFDFDMVLYTPNRECSTCQFEKVARSKHCATCDRCVSRFDHHCIWLNNCVGERNYRWFLIFLAANSIIMLYGIWASGAIIFHDLYGPKNLINAKFRNRVTGDVQTAGVYMLFQYFMGEYLEVMMVLLLCLVMGIIVTGFTFYHFYLTTTNTTTNETFKKSEITASYKHVLKRYGECIKRANEEAKAGRPVPADVTRFFRIICGEGWDGKMESVGPPPTNPLKTSLYNLGAKRNWMEVILPPSLYGRPAGTTSEGSTVPALDGIVHKWVRGSRAGSGSGSSSSSSTTRDAAIAATSAKQGKKS